MPSAIESSMAWRPGSVAGILMKTFGRSTISLSRAASRLVASVSDAMSGSTSSDTQPSRPLPESHTGRRMSQARFTSVTASLKKTSLSSASSSISSRISSSYESESKAFWKIDGLVVTPTTASSSIRRSSSPLSIISRERESIQTLWPRSDSWCSGDLLIRLLSVVALQSLTCVACPLNSAAAGRSAGGAEPLRQLVHPAAHRQLGPALDVGLAIPRALDRNGAQRGDVLEAEQLVVLVLERAAHARRRL